MKTAFFTGLKKIEICDRPEPQIARPDEVKVRIEGIGVCGSDVHYYLEGGIGGLQMTYPTTLGHECAGTIVEVGPAVTNVKVGDRAAIDPAISCMQCDQCLAGREHTCRKISFMGSPYEAPGAAAEYYVLPARNCFPVPASMSIGEAITVEPLTVGLHAVRLVATKPNAKIAVLGVGPIGLSVLQCLKATGPCEVWVADLLDERLAIAKNCGADLTVNASRDSTEKFIRDGRPLGMDAVFECTGDPACAMTAARLITPGGTVAIVGIPPVKEVPLDFHLLRRTEATIKNVRRQCGCVPAILDLLAAKRISARPLLTHEFPLDKINEAFELVAARKDGVIKAVVRMY